MSRKHEITVYLHAETQGGLMVNESPLHGSPPTPHVWLPKSQCAEIGRETIRHDGGGIKGHQITLEVPEWLLLKNGLDGLV